MFTFSIRGAGRYRTLVIFRKSLDRSINQSVHRFKFCQFLLTRLLCPESVEAAGSGGIRPRSTQLNPKYITVFKEKKRTQYFRLNSTSPPRPRHPLPPPFHPQPHSDSGGTRGSFVLRTRVMNGTMITPAPLRSLPSTLHAS